jgi:hypothetical protein
MYGSMKLNALVLLYKENDQYLVILTSLLASIACFIDQYLFTNNYSI